MSQPLAGAPVLIEVCAQDAAGCRAAEAGGADRIELCCALSEGGLTPTLGLLEAARNATSLPIVALLRPRRGDFVYDAEERRTQALDLQHLVRAGIDGVALGALLPSGELDVELLTELVGIAGDLPVTCHRAFDHAADPLASLDRLIDLGFRRLLSSGQELSAPAGAALLARLVQHAGPRLEVIAGGGVRPDNVAELVRVSGVGAVHLSAGRDEPSPMLNRAPAVPMAAPAPPNEFVRRVTDELVVRSCRRALA